MTFLLPAFLTLLAAYLLYSGFRQIQAGQRGFGSASALFGLGLMGLGYLQMGPVGSINLAMNANPGVDVGDLKVKFDALMKDKDAAVGKAAEERKALQVEIETLKKATTATVAQATGADPAVELKALQGKLDAATKAQAAAEAALATAKADGATAMADAQKAKAGVEAAAAGQKSMQGQVGALRDSLTKSNNALMARYAATRELDGKVTMLSADLKAANDAKVAAVASCDATKKATEVKASNACSAETEKMAGSAKGLQSQVGVLLGALNNANTALFKQRSSYRALEAQAATAGDGSATLKADLDAANARAVKAEADAAAARGQSGTILAALSSSNSTLLKEKGSMRAMQAQADQKLTQRQLVLDAADARIIQLEQQVAQLEQQNATTVEKLGQRQLVLNAADARIIQLEQQEPAAPVVMTNDAGLQKLRTELDETIAKLASMKTEVAAAYTAREAAELRYGQLQTANIVTYNQIEQGLGLVRSRASNTKCGIGVNANPRVSGMEAPDRIKRELSVLSNLTCTPPAPAVVAVAEPPKAPEPDEMALLKQKLSAPVTTDFYGVKLHPSNEMVQGRKGGYYVIDVKNAATKAPYRFVGGGYILGTDLPQYETSVKALIADIVGRLDGKVGYELMVRGKADAQPMKNKRPITGPFAQHAYLPLAGDGSGSYSASPVAVNLTGQVLENRHLPNLRAASLADVISRIKGNKKPEILEGTVSEKLDVADRNAEVVLYINW
jgi:hypothetical protein